MTQANHINRRPFAGVLAYVDTPSERAPSGARGHCVVLMRGAAEAALPGLLGMGVCYKSRWDGHDVRRKIGVIDRAEIVDNAVKVWGYLFGKDFPDVVLALTDQSVSKLVFGMSYELSDAHVTDMQEPVWSLNKVTFTGAAILLRERAAYDGTSFWLTGGPDDEESRKGFEEGSEENAKALKERAWQAVVHAHAFSRYAG